MKYSYAITANKYTFELGLIADSNVFQKIAGPNEATLISIGERWVEQGNRVVASETLYVAENDNRLPPLRPTRVVATQ